MSSLRVMMRPPMHRVLSVVVVLLLCLLGCEGRSDQPEAKTREQGRVGQSSEIAKVKVTRTGAIYLNGKGVTMGELKEEFARLTQVNGAVRYHRENPQGEPPPEALAVIQAIIDAKLPVKLLEKDFD